VQADIKTWPFKVVPDDKDRPMLEVTEKGGKVQRYFPEKIAAMLLTEIKRRAQEVIGKDVR